MRNSFFAGFAEVFFILTAEAVFVHLKMLFVVWIVLLSLGSELTRILIFSICLFGSSQYVYNFDEHSFDLLNVH